MKSLSKRVHVPSFLGTSDAVVQETPQQFTGYTGEQKEDLCYQTEWNALTTFTVGKQG